MLGVLFATVVFTALVTAGLAVLVALTVLPVFVSLQLADARHFSTPRWFTLSAGAVLVGLGYADALHRHGHLPLVVIALPLLFTWAGPGALCLLEGRQTRIGGRSGQHE